jgi:hypothetical protein
MTWVKNSFSMRDISLELRDRVNYRSGECHCRDCQELCKQLHDKALTRYYELTCPDKIEALASSASVAPTILTPGTTEFDQEYKLRFRNGSEFVSTSTGPSTGRKYVDTFGAVWDNVTTEADKSRKRFYAMQTLYNRIAWIIMVLVPYRRN